MTFRERRSIFGEVPRLEDAPFECSQENYERCIRLVRQTLVGAELDVDDQDWLDRSTRAARMRNTMVQLVFNSFSESHKNKADVDTVIQRVQEVYQYPKTEIRKAVRLIERYFDGGDRHMTSRGYDWLDTQPELRNAALDAVAVDADDEEVIRVIMGWQYVWRKYHETMAINAQLDKAGLFKPRSW